MKVRRRGLCRTPSSVLAEGVEVRLDAGAYVAKRRGIARRAQRADVGLGKALITSPELGGERDVTDGAFAVPRDDGVRHLVECGAGARADVEDAGHHALLIEPEIYGGHVADIHEVTTLL